MLTKAGLAVIGALSTGREATAADLAMETEYSQTHLYDVLDELLESGLLAEHRGANNQREVSSQTTQSSKRTGPFDPNSDTLNGPTFSRRLHSGYAGISTSPDVCLRLPSDSRLLGKASTRRCHRSSIARCYPLRPGVRVERGPLTAAGVRPRRRATRAPVASPTLAPSATIEWCDPKRALVRVQTAEDTEALEAATDWQLTGLARFAEYGLQFFLAGEPAFWYAPDEELTPGEVVCHTLALDSGSRRVSYAMLLIEALDIDQETLTDTSTWYDLETTVAAMYQALQEGSKTRTRSLSSFQVNQNLWRSKSSTV